MMVEEEIDDRVEIGKSRDIRSELASVDLKKQTTHVTSAHLQVFAVCIIASHTKQTSTRARPTQLDVIACSPGLSTSCEPSRMYKVN